MNKILFLLLAVCLGLAACQPAGITPRPTLSPAVPPRPPTPAPTATLAPTRPPAASATPAAALPDGVTNLAGAALCDLFPGLSPCQAAALPAAGRLAVVAAVGGSPALQVLVADFKAGTAWQVGNLPAPVTALKWSPSGQALAVFFAGGREQTYLADGTLAGSSDLPASASWNSQDKLETGRFQVVTAANGDRAWIDFDTALAHIERAAAPGKDIAWPMEPQQSDKIYQAVAWVPGSDLLMAGYTRGGNAAMLLGPTLVTLDPNSGAVRDLQTSLLASFQMAWHPTEAGLLLLAETGAADSLGGQRLALLNVLNGQKTYPVPDQMQASISWPAFTPDGKAAIFASYLAPEQAGPGHPLGALAIYQVTLAGGELKRLTTPPAGAQDNRPRLLADGVHFVYYRVSPAAPATLVARLGALDGSGDAALTGPLAAPACPVGPGSCAWDSVIAVSW